MNKDMCKKCFEEIPLPWGDDDEMTLLWGTCPKDSQGESSFCQVTGDRIPVMAKKRKTVKK